MKVQCDVCASEAASVFCCADEAALCDACDRRVHRANKLAGKHRRFSLLSPTTPASSLSSGSGHQQQPPPLCDICQEKRGLLFCKEDRAILCRDCDVSVHTTSELTMRHTRFLLTGVRLSAEPAACPAPPSSEDENTSGSSFCCHGAGSDAAAAAPASHGASSGSDSSSISEYLTKTLPGWHVEDFLVDDTAQAAAAAASTTTTTIGGVSADASYHHHHHNHHQGQGGIAAAIGGLQHGYSAWMAQEQLFSVSGDARAHYRERWVPQVYADMTGSKRPRTTTTTSAASYYSYW